MRRPHGSITGSFAILIFFIDHKPDEPDKAYVYARVRSSRQPHSFSAARHALISLSTIN